MNDLAISVRNLGKAYKIGAIKKAYKTFRESLIEKLKHPLSCEQSQKIWALKEVSFEVRKGEVVGVIGKNGAGKSTLLKILSRITEPTAGEANLYGRVGSLLEVGTGFHLELTGRENIYLNGAIIGMKRREIVRKFDEIVAFSELDKFVDTPVKHYSSGMYMRLAFAVAAHLETEIMLVDEVLAVGDAAFQAKCLGKMNEVAQAGKTVLFVSHNMAAIKSFCSRVFLVENGRLLPESSPEVVINKYLSTGTTPYNWAASRQSKGPVKFEQLKILNSLKNETGSVRSGDPVTFQLKYKSERQISSKALVFHIFCISPLIGRIFTCSTRFASKIEKLPLSGAIECVVPKLPLRAGSYHFQIVAKVDEVISDLIENAAHLDVAEGDFFGTGKNPPHNEAIFLVEQEWKLL